MFKQQHTTQLSLFRLVLLMLHKLLDVCILLFKRELRDCKLHDGIVAGDEHLSSVSKVQDLQKHCKTKTIL